MNNLPTGVIMDSVLEMDEEVIENERWEDREDEDNEDEHE